MLLHTRRLDLILAPAVALLAIIVFAGTLHGDWVYDDELLILTNSLVQDPRLFWTALGSDLFAARSADATAGSHYWRPTTTLWFIVHHRLYGVESTAGWHAGSILLHGVATLLAFAVLRRLGFSAVLAAAAAAIFAVHPTRVENVAWISGAGDLLAAVGLLGSLWFLLGIVQRREARDDTESRGTPIWVLWTAALGLYALALGAKEFTVLFPAVVFAAAAWPLRASTRRLRAAGLLALPFLGLTIVYLVARWQVLGPGSTPAAEGGVLLVIKSIPVVGAFYLRQMLLPIWLAPVYPVTPVVEPGIGNFVLPLMLVAAVGAAMLWISLGRPARGGDQAGCGRAGLVGTLLFLIAVAPAATLVATSPTLMVQDRYLYLPLLGFAAVVLCGLRWLLDRRAGGKADIVLAACTAMVCVPLAAQTLRYSAAWMNSTDLWAWSVRLHPQSGFAWGQYGGSLLRDGRPEEAAQALDRAADAGADPAQLAPARTEALIRLGRFDEAERIVLRHLEHLNQRTPDLDHFYATEQLMRIALLRDDDVDRAVGLLRSLRDRAPNFHGIISDRIAVIFIVDERPEQALAELQAARPRIAQDRTDEGRWVYYRLGALYLQQGRPAEAQVAFEDFLLHTAGTGNLRMQEARGIATEAIAAIRRGRPISVPPLLGV